MAKLCLLAISTLITFVLGIPFHRQRHGYIIVTPALPPNARVTADNTINTTLNILQPLHTAKFAAAGNLRIGITNNFGDKPLYAYVIGRDPNGLPVMLQPNGQWFYPTSSSSSVPQVITEDVQLRVGANSTTEFFTMPTYLDSGRIYISEGPLIFLALQSGSSVSLVHPDANNPSDPSADMNWGFVELTYNGGGLYSNLSFVDFIGLPLGMTVTMTDGQSNCVRGISSSAVSTICNGLEEYAGLDDAPWGDLCYRSKDGTPLRVVAPQKHMVVDDGAFKAYYDNYVHSVWNKYASQALIIDSQVQSGTFHCSTSSGELVCAGGNRAFSKPSARDIFGCEGTFQHAQGDNDVVLAATARICAAFGRTTLLHQYGDSQPSLGPDSYYKISPTNRYSQLVHSVEMDGHGYAFPYDDVNPSGSPNQSGVLASTNAASLTVIVGGS